jgi:hypothetical protein
MLERDITGGTSPGRDFNGFKEKNKKVGETEPTTRNGT